MSNTINYDQPVKDLIAEHNKSGHVTHRSYNKKTVTFHHNGGMNLSHEAVLKIWKTRPASAHFDVDRHGDVAQYVKALEYAWATGSTDGNIESISIELANASRGPKWEVSETTWKSGARLAGWLFAKVIKARPNKSNLFVHNHWKSTICAGPSIEAVWDEIMAETQRWYDHFTKPAEVKPSPAKPSKPKPSAPPKEPKKSLEQLAREVWQGKWGSSGDRVRRLTQAGYDADAVQRLVNKGVGRSGPGRVVVESRKSVNQLAREVIAGHWGNGETRVRRLKAAGYDPGAVQKEVNKIL